MLVATLVVAAAAGSDVMLVGMLEVTGVAGHQVVEKCCFQFLPSLSLPQPPPGAAHFWFELMMVCCCHWL